MLTSELIAQVRLMGSITSDTVDADILLHADMEVQSRLLPFVRNINDDYLVRAVDIPIVNGRAPIPARAAGAAVRLVQLITGGQLYTLPRIDPMYDPGTPPSSAQPYGFYFDAGSICVLPSASSGTLRVRYFARPGKLVSNADTTRCAPITAVTPGATTTAVTSTYAGSQPIDVISSGPAHQHKAISVTPPAAIPNDSIFEAIAVGDYVSQADSSPFVALPEEMASVLVSRTAARILAAAGYVDEASYQDGRALEQLEQAALLLRPRADGNPKRMAGGTLALAVGPWPLAQWRRW